MEEWIYDMFIKDYPKTSYRNKGLFQQECYSKFFALYVLKNNILTIPLLEKLLDDLDRYMTRGKGKTQDLIFSIGFDCVSDILSYAYGTIEVIECDTDTNTKVLC